jgi:hypothetical protein
VGHFSTAKWVIFQQPSFFTFSQSGSFFDGQMGHFSFDKNTFRPAEGQTALAGVVKRYLYAYGPATPQHFAQWLAAPRGWAIKLFDSLAHELQPVEVEGTLAWAPAGDTQVPSTPPKGVRLLPYFVNNG